MVDGAFFNTLWEDFLAVLILAVFGLIMYMKFKNKTLKEAFDDIKGAFQ